MSTQPRQTTFSQAQGYEELPKPLKLEQLPEQARTLIWNVVYLSLEQHVHHSDYGQYIDGPWFDILYDHWYGTRPIDQWTGDFHVHVENIRDVIQTAPFNEVFDFIHVVLRHPKCPPGLTSAMKRTFAVSRLAYIIDDAGPPTIFPATTEAEGAAIVESTESLSQAGLDGSASHLRKASDRINAGDWAGSIRESISAVESAARQLDPEASKDLGKALVSLSKRQTLHPALKEAFSKLYGYTSNEQGIRHALLDQSSANVDLDEAVFMLGACASFASYLWRKDNARD